MTAICPPASSRHSPLRGRCILGTAALLAALPAAAQSLVVDLDSVSHPLFSLGGLRLKLESVGAAGPAELEIARLRMGALSLASLKLRCAALRLSAGAIDCPHGELMLGTRRGDSLPLRFTYVPGTQALDLTLEPASGERWTVRSRRGSTELRLQNAHLARLNAVLPALAAYRASAIADGRLLWRSGSGGQTVSTDVAVKQLTFSDRSGEHAGEKLAGRVQAQAEHKDGDWRWRVDVRWDSGEAYFKPFYFASGGHKLQARGRVDAGALAVDEGSVTLAQVGMLDFSGSWDRRAAKLVRARFATGEIALDKAAPVLLKPLLEQQALPPVEAEGRLQAAGEWDGEGLARLDLRLAGVTAVEGNGRFGLQNVTAAIPWRRNEATEAEIRVGGAGFGRLPLGAFRLPLRLRGLTVEMPRVEIPLLDGALLIEGLHAAKEGEQWRWQFGGALYPVSMSKLAAALGLPPMAGSVSASIPRIRHSRSTIEMDGALIVQVFDGYVAMDNLKLIEPLGRLPRLYGDLDVRHIDLGQLTETFSFGSITGYVDGEVKGLELAGWRPQRFAAHIESSPGDYRKRISQRAVQNISALGGAGAAAAIQRSLLRFFEEFGYSRLGLSCVLADGVCRMGGVETAPQGYVIVKGGGVPAINVIGYNRNVDWEELVSRLKRITAGNAKPIIQ